MNERKTFFEAIWMNWNLLWLVEDPLVEIKWTIYFDGTVRKRVEYRKSGEINSETVRLSEIEFADFRELLDKNFLSSEACEGMVIMGGAGWEMSLYSEEGKIIHHISGQIYDVKPLEKIADALREIGTTPPYNGPLYVPRNRR